MAVQRLNVHGVEAGKRLQYVNEVASSRRCPGAHILATVRLTFRFLIVPICVDITCTGVFYVFANRRWASRVQLGAIQFWEVSVVLPVQVVHVCVWSAKLCPHDTALIVTVTIPSECRT
jgi:hypothetical protein